MAPEGVPAPLPLVAEYARAQRAEKAAAVSAVRRLWERVDPDDFNAGFFAVAPQMFEVVNTAQLRISQRAAQYVPQVLEATGQTRAVAPRAVPPVGAFVGTAGDGRPTETLLYGAVPKARAAISAGQTPVVARNAAMMFLTLSVSTIMADTMRSMEGLQGYVRPVSGWVRQLSPPSCGRCVILAGKWFAKNRGFERHPQCDCIHIPAAENVGRDFLTNPDTYLKSLSDEELLKALGSRANVLAYREYGADAVQLINMYRAGGGIRTAQLYGKNVKYVLEGTTTRGVAFHQMSRVRELSALVKNPGERYRRLIAPRLMPESIFSIANNQDHALRLLRDHGWLGITA